MGRKSKVVLKALSLFDDFLRDEISTESSPEAIQQLKDHIEKWVAHKATDFNVLADDVAALEWDDEEEEAITDFITRTLHLREIEEISDDKIEDLLQENRLFAECATSAMASENISIYLKDIHSYKTLKQEESRALARIVQLGIEASETLKHDEDLLPPEEIAELKSCVAKGQKAKNRLIEGNLIYPVLIAKRYAITGADDLMDLIQEGNRGLMRAVDLYDPTKPTSFSTYASYWISKACRMMRNKASSVISLPQGIYEDNYKIRKTITAFAQQGKDDPSIEEIAEETDLSQRRVESVQQIIAKTTTLSIDEQIKNIQPGAEVGEELTVLSGLEDKAAAIELVQVERAEVSQHLSVLFRNLLTPIEAKVLILRHGAEDNVPRRLETIADELGYTKERIRQIEETALKKLQSSVNINLIHSSFIKTE